MMRWILLGLLMGIAQAQEITSYLEDQTAVSITIYNDDLALIRDQRQVRLPKGRIELALRGVSARIRPETALLRSLSHSGSLMVLEQNFNFDLLTPHKMLQKYVGKMIKIRRINPATGKVSIEKAKVLSVQDGLVVQIGQRIETNPQGEFIFDQIPENLRDQPTLVNLIDNHQLGLHTIELSYLSSGLSWKADYVAYLNEKNNALDLAGWVTLTNRSGTAYRRAQLQLIAGDVNRVPEPQISAAPRRYMEKMAVADQAMQEESLFEYHLYTLPRKTDILDQQTKQVALLSASKVRARKEWVLEGQSYYYTGRYGQLGESLDIAVYILFENRQQDGLGLPLPKGTVRVYQQDSRGQAQFIGEDRIDHTPENETIRLKLGNAFDVKAKKVQTYYKKRNYGHPYNYAAESHYRIELNNAKSEAVVVKIKEYIPHDWRILEENHPHQKVAANQVIWAIEVPPKSKAKLEYQVLVRY